MDDVSSTDVSELSATLHRLKAGIGNVDDDARKALVAELQGLLAALRSPVQVFWQMLFQSIAPSALMTLVDMGAIDVINNSPSPVSAAHIAHSCGAEELLVYRLVRPLMPMGIIKEEGEGLYSATPLSRLLSDPALKGGFVFMFGPTAKVLAAMPEFLKKNGYRNVDTLPGPFQYALNTELPMFPWIMQDKALMTHFNTFMSSARIGRPEWFTHCPVRDMFLDGARPDCPLLVDVGGGEGHDTAAFHSAYPQAPGGLIVQDLPQVIGNIRGLDPAIKTQAHDFFTPQPIKGARVYYFRQIFHDYGDDAALKILANTRSAMTPGYSKILCNEFCLPDMGVAMYPALLDLNMLALLSGTERTSKQWHALMDRAGLRILNIHSDPTGEGESIIEVSL